MTLSNHNRCECELDSPRGNFPASRKRALGLLGWALLLAVTLIQSGCVGLTGAESSDGLVFSPGKVDFGEVVAGAKKQVTATLTNTTANAVTLPQATIAGSTFSVSGLELPATVEPGGILTFTATFAPMTAGSTSGTVIVSSEGPGSSPVSLALSGVGLSAAGPTITTQPGSQSVLAGQSASFSVNASGTAPLSYQWKKNGSSIGGATASSYTTPPTSSSDSGAQFTVTVTDSVGSVTSDAATLTVTTAPVAPSITSQPANRTVTVGQPASFSVTATGTSPMAYQWRKNGATINGATASSYTTPSATSGDNGAQYSVIVLNSVGSVTSASATLTVNSPVTITSQPVNRSVTAGQTATFSVVATGSFSLGYQWKKNGANINGAIGSRYTTPATTIADNGARFSVVVTGAAGSVTSNSATLTVTAASTAPAITSQPASQTVTAGQTATFSVTATGTGPLSYQWRRGGSNISGATGSSYTTPATTSADNGAQFSVVVTGAGGSVTSNNAVLTVTTASVAPSITSQPPNRTVVAGQTASFSVTAGGTSPLRYQWRKNGANIGGATSASYTTPVTTTADNGAQFTVVVSNSIGSVTSNAGTLTVNAATRLLSSSATALNFGNVSVGSSKVMSATISNTGNSSVSIGGVALSGPGFSAGGVSSGLTLNPGQTTTLNVTFAPASASAAAGSVTVSSNATNSPVTITLSGAGVQPVQHTSNLSWNASTSSVTGYYAYRGNVSGGPYTKLNSSPVPATSYSDSTVQAGQRYYYVVTAADSGGTESTFSNEVSAVVPAP